MGNEELAEVSAYICCWFYYLFWLLLDLETGIITLFLGIQLALESYVLYLYSEGARSAIYIRTALTVVLLILCGLSVRSIVNKHAEIPPIICWKMARISEKNGSLVRAVSYYQKAEKKGEQESAFYIQYAEALHKLGRNKEALVKVKVAGESPDTNLMLGRIYFSLQNYNKAKEYFEKTVRDDPENPLALAWLAETCLKLSQNHKAQELFLTLLKIPGLPDEMKAAVSKRIQELKTSP